jgi:hypothetical protein
MMGIVRMMLYQVSALLLKLIRTIRFPAWISRQAEINESLPPEKSNRTVLMKIFSIQAGRELPRPAHCD